MVMAETQRRADTARDTPPCRTAAHLSATVGAAHVPAHAHLASPLTCRASGIAPDSPVTHPWSRGRADAAQGARQYDQGIILDVAEAGWRCGSGPQGRGQA